MEKIFKYKEKDRFVLIEIVLFSILILGIGLRSINNLYGIITGVDDFGYICNANYFLGIERWKDLAGTLSYYSYGYSLVLLPLMMVFKNPIILFRGIVIMNVCMLVASFMVSIKVVEKMHKSISKRVIVFACFIANIYPANFVYSKYVFSEILVVLLFWILLLLLLNLCDDYNWKSVVLLGIICVYTFYVHQRTLSVLCAIAFTLLILALKKKIPVKGALFFFLIAIILIFAGKYVKGILIDSVYQNNEQIGINDFSGQISKLKYVFNKNNIFNIMLGFLGKIYYFLVSTVFVGGLGLIQFIKKSLFSIWGKESKEENYAAVFISITFLLMMLIQTYFLMIPDRFDMVIYGRYIEFMYGILIVEGMFAIMEYFPKEYKNILILLFVAIVCGCSAIVLFERLDLKILTTYLIPAVYGFFNVKYNLKESMYLSLLIIAIACIFLLFNCKIIKRKEIRAFSVALVLVFFWTKNYSLINNDILNDQKLLKDEYLEMANYITDYSGEIDILYEDNLGLDRMRELQYLCPDKELHLVAAEDIQGFPNHLILTERATLFEEELRTSGRNVIYYNYRYYLWKK